MDLNDVWQQNRRWILGVVAGLLLFWIATAIVRSLYDADAAERKVAALANSNEEFFDAEARKAANASGTELEAVVAQARKELEFVPSERFVLAGKGDHDSYFDEVMRSVRTALVDKAQQLGVELTGERLVWDPPIGQAEVERTLLGLGVLDTAVTRLLTAGDEVRANDPEALGLQGIDRFEIETKQKAGAPRRVWRPTDRRGAKAPAADVSDRVDEHAVSFKFRADAPTVEVFLEKCRSLAPRLVLREGFKVKSGKNAGDPLVVTGSIAGIRVRDA